MSNNPDSKALMLATRQQLEAQQTDFEAVLPAGVTFDKFRNVVLLTLAQKPELASADRRSLFLACRRCAADGLLPDGREAALVAYGNKVQYQPMVTGLRKLAMETGIVKSIRADVVRRGEPFINRITMDGPEFLHEKPLEGEIDETDAGIIAAYAIARFDNGDSIVHVMRLSELLKRKNASKQPDGAWTKWFAEMCRKTAMLSLCRHFIPPINDAAQRLIAAAAREDEEIALPPGRPPKAAVERTGKSSLQLAAPSEYPAPPASVDPPRTSAPVEAPPSPAANLDGEAWETERKKVAAIATDQGFPESYIPGDDDMPSFLNDDFDRRMSDDKA